MLVTILIVVALAIAALLIYAATKPDSFRVERTARIKALPQAIFPYINDLRSHGAWSPYDTNPATKRTFNGAPNGKGQVFEWDGDRKAGAGRIEITDAAPPSRVTMKLDMLRPFAAHNIVEFTLGAAGRRDRRQLGYERLAALHGQAGRLLHELRQDGRRAIRARPRQPEDDCRTLSAMNRNRRRVPMSYVDGFVVPVPKKKLAAYRKMARAAGKVWRDHGALDRRMHRRRRQGRQVHLVSAQRQAQEAARRSCSRTSSTSRARSATSVNAKVMKDERLAEIMDPKQMPFDGKRMIYGGFNTIVSA